MATADLAVDFRALPVPTNAWICRGVWLAEMILVTVALIIIPLIPYPVVIWIRRRRHNPSTIRFIEKCEVMVLDAV